MPPLGNQYSMPVTGTVDDVAKLRYQIDTYLRQRNPNAPSVGQYYAEFGRRFGIRPEIAAAQAIIETASFRFTGQVPAGYHNPAGLKCQGAFIRFPNWEQGIHAHLERLNCYVRPEDESGEGGRYDPCYGHWRYQEILSMGYRPDSVMGVVSLWTGKCDPKNLGYDLCLENKLRYAQGIAQHAEGILAIPYSPGLPPSPPPPGEQPTQGRVWLIALGALGIGAAAVLLSRRRS